MFRGTVMAGLLVSNLLTVLPSVTFADGRDGDRRDDKGRHSLVQYPYGVRSPFVTLQAQIDALKSQINQLTVDKGALATLTENNRLLKAALMAAQDNITALQGNVTTLETKTADIIPLGKYIKIDTNLINGVKGPHILITGVNVHVRSGSGFTNDNGGLTGLGNLIIGYNENTTPTPTLPRTGSHNLVGGSMNSFSSFGGMVFGLQNTISGQYASVLGGNQNKAEGSNSTVYGGSGQMAVNLNSYAPQGARPAPGQ
jgi:hypothetical protein